MPHKQDELGRQLKRANEALAEWTSVLDERGISQDQRHRDPVWRNLNAQFRQLRRRINIVGAVVDLDNELKSRKAKKASEVLEKKSPKKEASPEKKGDKKEAKKKDDSGGAAKKKTKKKS